MDEMNLRNYSYIGDAVWELFIREKTVKLTDNAKKLHQITTSKVKMGYQAELLHFLEDFLTDEEKVKMTEVVSMSKADFIKTSTGFSIRGASFEDVEIFNKYISNNTHIKAAGGIASLEDAERFLNLGADRLGTSKIIGLIK